MNDKEIGEIRRHLRRDRSNITAIYGCYVNDNKEVISEFRQSTGIMPENESDKYFALLRRSLSGAIGKNLIDITFKTSQVAGSPEHKMLMDLRETKLADDNLRREFCQKIIDTITIEGNYLILLCCDSYDVPFKSKDGDSQADNSDLHLYPLRHLPRQADQGESSLRPGGKAVPRRRDEPDGLRPRAGIPVPGL